MDIEEVSLLKEIQELREILKEKETKLALIRRAKDPLQECGLSSKEIAKYSRQIFVPEITVAGQKKLGVSSVLIVGVGGLGCPAALYLVSAGVGHIGLVDYDDIEINNLHRQILFTEANIGASKVTTAKEHLNRINSYTKVIPYKIQLDSSNAFEIIKQYDVVLDATDNAATRYLLNDACVLLKKPLISGSALRLEGHLSVYNYNGPCYRCIFPKPPPVDTVTNCGDGGVLGAAVGTIGVLQALETIKVILGMPGVLSGRFLMFDGSETKFRNINLRSRNPECTICGRNPTIKELIDYEQFCGAKANDKSPMLWLLKQEDRITVEKYNEIVKLNAEKHLLVDVRSSEEYDICRLKNSINIPLKDITNGNSLKLIKEEVEKKKKEKDVAEVYVICRRGNDSQKAVAFFHQAFKDDNFVIKDIIGGIHAWTNKIDPEFPIY